VARGPAGEVGHAVEGAVPAEQLVPAEAGEDHLGAVGGGEVGDAVGVEAVEGGLVHGVEVAEEQFAGVAGIEPEEVVVHAEAAGDAPGEAGLVVIHLAEADGVAAQAFPAGGGGHGGHGGGIDPPAEKEADGDVTDEVGLEAAGERLADAPAERLSPRGLGLGRERNFFKEGERQLLPRLGGAGLVLRPGAGAVLPDPLGDGVGPRQAAGAEVAVEPGGVDPARDPAGGEHGADLAGEEELPVGADGGVEGLDAEGVAGEQEAAVLRVEQTEGEHAAEGLMPKVSRASRRRPSSAWSRPKANMPRNFSRAAGPSRTRVSRRTSVSLVERKRWPARSSAGRRSRKL